MSTLARTLGVMMISILLLLLVVANASGATRSSMATFGNGARVVAEDHPALNPTGGITIEAWVRPTSFAGFPTIYGKKFSAAQWLGLTPTGRLRFYPSGSGSSRDGVDGLSLAEWNHVAVTYDPATGRRQYYIDGNLDLDLTTGAAAIGVSSLDLGIGAEADGTFPFIGNLSQVRVWNSVRSQGEIRANLWRQLQPSDDVALQAVWPLDGFPDEASGEIESSAVAAPTFPTFSAPPTPDEPVRLPQIVGDTSPDGVCGPTHYAGATLLPIWFDDEPLPDRSPSMVEVGADSTYLYFCFPPRGIPYSGFVEVIVDGGNNGGSFPLVDDYRFRIFTNGAVDSFRGSGGQLFPWSIFSVPGYAAGRAVIAEFEEGYEMRIPRSVITSADGLFRLQISDTHAQSFGDPPQSYGWPDEIPTLLPPNWELAEIDDTPQREDALVPRVRITQIAPAEGLRTTADPIDVSVIATDDVDLQSVEVEVDGVLVRICDSFGTDDREVDCSLNLGTMALGPHTVRAYAVDHLGREDRTRLESFRIVIDGEVPTLTIAHSPRELVGLGIITIDVEASDPSGISEIVIETSPFGSHTCTFSSSNPSQSCSFMIATTPATRIIRYSARAEDNELMTFGSSTRIVLVNNVTTYGRDDDFDGISNEHEAHLCTNPLDPDTDGDALPDKWELLGVPDAAGTGVFVDLPDMGANPCYRDVFFQYDYEVGARVNSLAIPNIVTSFRDRRIRLHVEENGRPRVGPTSLSPLSSANAMYQTAGNGGQYWFPGERHWTHYYGWSAHRVGRSGGADRRFTLDIYTGNAPHCVDGANADRLCSSDIDCPGSTCMLSCDCPTDGSIDPATCGEDQACRREDDDGQSLRFMHELGHAVGLGHGGRVGIRTLLRDGEYAFYPGVWDNANHKPNYMSLMNYTSNGNNRCVTPEDDLVMELGYSTQALPDLDEANLDERVGALTAALSNVDCSYAVFGSVPAIAYTCLDPDEANLGNDIGRRFVMISDGVQTVTRMGQSSTFDSSPPGHAPGIDFDCDGSISASVQVNLNGDNGDFRMPTESCDGTDNNGDGFVDLGCNWGLDTQILEGREDWQHIPSPPACQVEYDVGDSCYLWPQAYRDALGSHAIDCRPVGNSANECATNPPTYPGGPGRPTEPDFMMPPGIEVCDGFDNDEDGEIDEGCRDNDGDGVSDSIDSCPNTSNPTQLDVDRDGLGDACENPTGSNPAVFFNDQNGVGLFWASNATDLLGWNVRCEHPMEEAPRFLGALFPTTPSKAFAFVPAWGGTYRCEVTPVDLLGQDGAVREVIFTTDLNGDGVPDPDEEPVPEPGLGVGVLLGVMLLILLGDRRSERPLPG